MSDAETTHQGGKMALRSRRKCIRDLTGGNTLVSRAAKQQKVPALGRVDDKTYRVGWEENVLPVGPKVKVSSNKLGTQ